MLPMMCPHCGGRVEIESEPQLTPFLCPACQKGVKPIKNGMAWILTPAAVFEGESMEKARSLALEAEKETDPVKKHALLCKAAEICPRCFEAQQGLLYLGRLYERSPKRLDFHVIKCYLLHVFDKPQEHAVKEKASMLTELFSHPQLLVCLALAPDREGFLLEYLTKLSQSYICLFLKGNAQYMRLFFGFATGKPEKLLAVPAAMMIANMRNEEGLPREQRALLARAFYNAFAIEMGGATEHLDSRLHAREE